MMKNLTLKKTLNAMLFAGLVITAPVTMAAAEVNSMLQADGINGFQDQDRDRILRETDGAGDVTYNGTNYDVMTSGSFEVGDIFQAALRFDTVDWLDTAGDTINSQTLGSLSNPIGVYGYSEIKIDSKILFDLFDPAGNPIFEDDGITQAQGAQLSFSGANVLSNSNVLVELYEVNPDTLDIFGFGITADQAISTVRSQSLIAEFGIIGNDFWTALVGSDISSLSLGYGDSQQASGDSGLSLISNAGDLPVEVDGVFSDVDGNFHDLVGNASAFGSGANGWLTNTNSSIFIKTPANVPEPSSLALMGIAVLMLGGMSTRRRKV